MLPVFFKKRISLANGLALSGSLLGRFILSPMWVYFTQTFSTRGALILMSGCFLNITVFAALFRPVEFYKRRGCEVQMRQSVPPKGTPGTTGGNKKGTVHTTNSKNGQFSIELSLFKEPLFTLFFITCFFSMYCYTECVSRASTLSTR